MPGTMRNAASIAATLMLCTQLPIPAVADDEVPLPRPRPERLGGIPAATPKPPRKAAAPPTRKAAKQPVPVFDPAQAKACEDELRQLGVRFTVGKEIDGEDQCGVKRPVVLQSVAPGVTTSTAPGLNCTTALALAKWTQHVVVPSARVHLGQILEHVEVSTTYQCRRRNNASSGKLSEHAFGNGADIMSFRFQDGSVVKVAERDDSPSPKRAFQAAVRGGACALFTTVIGPGTNTAHADHLHVDMVRRRSGYRLCE